MKCSCSTVFRGDAPDFFEGCHPFNRLVDTGHTQRFHSFGHALVLDHTCGRAFDNETADRFAYRQRFDDRHPSEIAAAFAPITAAATVEDGIFFWFEPELFEHFL